MASRKRPMVWSWCLTLMCNCLSKSVLQCGHVFAFWYSVFFWSVSGNISICMLNVLLWRHMSVSGDMEGEIETMSPMWLSVMVVVSSSSSASFSSLFSDLSVVSNVITSVTVTDGSQVSGYSNTLHCLKLLVFQLHLRIFLYLALRQFWFVHHCLWKWTVAVCCEPSPPWHLTNAFYSVSCLYSTFELALRPTNVMRSIRRSLPKTVILKLFFQLKTNLHLQHYILHVLHLIISNEIFNIFSRSVRSACMMLNTLFNFTFSWQTVAQKSI